MLKMVCRVVDKWIDVTFVYEKLKNLCEPET
jgi:hypothetical protein